MTADPEDYSSTGRYNVTFCQTALTDGDVPANTTLSSPLLINITNDDIFEGVEYFQTRIVETSDKFRVRIGQDTVNITITDCESCMCGMHINPYLSTTIACVECLLMIINNSIVREASPSVTLVKAHIVDVDSDGMG